MSTKFKVQIKSVFTEISEVVFKMNNINDIKQYVVKFMESKNIDPGDKTNIINNINACTKPIMAHRYICNSLLRYEGLSLNKYESEKKEVKESE